MEVLCKCGKTFKTCQSRIDDGRGKYCSKECSYKYKTRKSGIKYKITKVNKGWFTKDKLLGNKFRLGKEPYNKGKKGLQGKNRTSFKKGHETWNKGINPEYMQWDKHFAFVDGHTAYRKFAEKNGKKPICEKCGKEGVFGNTMHIHHIDKDRSNNKIANLMVLCSKCHLNIHKNWEKRNFSA